MRCMTSYKIDHVIVLGFDIKIKELPPIMRFNIIFQTIHNPKAITIKMYL